jgi:hypothetical protein
MEYSDDWRDRITYTTMNDTVKQTKSSEVLIIIMLGYITVRHFVRPETGYIYFVRGSWILSETSDKIPLHRCFLQNMNF